MSDDTKREAAHTPGPWSTHYVALQGHAISARVKTRFGQTTVTVCYVLPKQDWVDTETAKANAALIAHAPDLAAEVERLREQRTKLLIEIDAFGKALTKAEDERDAERRKVEALREPTDAMVDAYLKANDAYWAEVDSLVSTVGVWRNGTPREATMVSLRAALASTEGGAK